MRNLLFILLAGIFIFGFTCAKNIIDPVCPPPDGQPSWICEKSAETGIEPEQVYGWIFSASAIAALADKVEIQEMCDFKKEISDWYVDIYPVTYDTLIAKLLAETKLFEDPRKVLLMKNMLNQNLQMYSSPKLIHEYDDWMIRGGGDKFDRDMMCE